MTVTKNTDQLPVLDPRWNQSVPSDGPEATEVRVASAQNVWQPQLSSPSSETISTRGVWREQAPAAPYPVNGNGQAMGYDPNMGNPNGCGYGNGYGNGFGNGAGLNPMVGAAMGAVGGVMLYHGLSSMLSPSGGYQQAPSASAPTTAADGGYSGGGDPGLDSGLGQESGADFTEV
ncbi:MAG: hypothetical protein QM523_00625 [Candidatus Pacebacteria bacterium]|nr:hypothetical protein [Candidatus Paceibacterota bacterium]